MLYVIYLVAAGLCVAVASGRIRWRLTPTARVVTAAGSLLLAYPFWSEGRRPGGADELPLTLIGLGLAAGAVLFTIGTLRNEGRGWRLLEVAGAGLMTLMLAAPTLTVFVLPLPAAVLGWTLRRAAGREVLTDPPPPRVAR